MARPPRAKTVALPQGGELSLKLPPGSMVLVLAGEGEVEVRSSAGAREPGAVRDLRVEKALRAMLAEPARRWTVEALARCAGLSRAAFTRAFRAATGETPHERLRRERLALAAELLRDAGRGLAEVASLVGYANEFALSRAFKRYFRLAPAEYRKALGVRGDAIRCAA